MAKNSIKKRLVYYFYGFDGYKNNRAIKMNLACLSYYANIFNESIFIISVDDTNNKKLIQEIEHDIISCGFSDISFKIWQNDSLCEASAFYKEVIQKLELLDGITFWGHTKGCTDFGRQNTAESSIEDWILGCYYLSLNDINDVEREMCYHSARFYGSFLTTTDYHVNRTNTLYSGTFFWINCVAIANDIKAKKAEKPTTPDERSYVEMLPGNLYMWEEGLNLSSFMRRITFDYNSYLYSTDALKFILREDYDNFLVFKTKINNSIYGSN